MIKSPFWIFKIGSLFDQAAIPSDLIDVSWCNRGAMGVEKMDSVLNGLSQVDSIERMDAVFP